LADLRAAVEEARANAGVPGGVAAIYGLTATLPAEMVQEALKAYLDYLYEV